MRNYLDWLLTEAYVRDQHLGRCANWLTVGLVLGGLLVYFT